MRLKNFFIMMIFISASILFSACPDITEYSEIPQIEYLHHSIKDSVNQLGNKQTFLILTFDVVDGDGDIGLTAADTVAPFDSIHQYNFFPSLFAKMNGVWDTLTEQGSEINYRIPYIEIENHKAYKAEIDVEFQFFTDLIPGDTIKYDFYILDRAFNKSNVESTPEIVLN